MLSSAKLCMLLVVEDTRSLMKIGNNVGDNSVPRLPTSPSVYRKYVNAFGTKFLVKAVSILPVERLYCWPIGTNGWMLADFHIPVKQSEEYTR